MAIFIDTETNGLPNMKDMIWGKYPQFYDLEKYNTARIVQLSFIVTDRSFNNIDLQDYIIKREGFTINNSEPASGGRDGDTVEELRENALRSFNEQGRAVTLQDYTVRALSLPSKFGSVAKVYVAQDQLTNTNLTDSIVDNNPLALALYVLGYDNNQNLITASDNLKANLKTYLAEFMLVTDSINIKDAFVVNIGVNYDIKIRPNYSSRDVIFNCNVELQDYFKVSKRSLEGIANFPLLSLSTSIVVLIVVSRSLAVMVKLEFSNSKRK